MTSKTLLALTGAALSLPGISGKAEAAAPLSETTVSLQSSLYREQGIASDKHGGGDRERYTIKTQQLRIAGPTGDHADVSVDIGHETMSGASPWYVTPGADGKPVQVMSGASGLGIREQRRDVQARGNAYLGKTVVASLLWGYSKEDDYRALNTGVELAKSWHNDQITLSGGVGYSDDEVTPVDTDRFADRIHKAERDNLSGFIGLGIIFNARTTAQFSLSHSDQQGFLSDPYKLAFVASPSALVADARPDEREQWVAQARLRHYVPGAEAAVHLDYRYFDDDWEVESHTTELGWFQNLPRDWRVDTTLRYYSQTQAFFYAPFYFTARDDGLASSDYRLSPYGALSLRLRAVKTLGDWELSAQWEGYEAKAGLSLDDVEVENPGLVAFDSYSIAFGRKF